jgi:immune inhibitor A
VLSVSHPLPRAALLLCWMSVLAMPAAAVMPTPQGTIAPEVVQAFEAGLFALPPGGDRLGTSAVQTVWNVPVIMVSFTDQSFGTSIYGPRTPRQYFDLTLFDTTAVTATGSVFDYYKWVSGNRIRVIGRVVAQITMPNTKAFYANNNWGLSSFPPRNTYGVVTGALQYADSLIDWRPYDQNNDGFVDMLWVIHSGLPGEATVATSNNLWSITSRLSQWSNGESFETHTLRPGGGSARIRVDRFSMMPELSAIHPGQPSEIGVYCHEFGHALGLPDLYDATVVGGGINTGPGNWSLMSTGAYGTDGASPEFPSHLGAWPLRWLGWRDSVRPTVDTLMVQGSIEGGAPLVEFWFQGEANSEYFLIENRQREGFDRNLPAEGLIVYQVDETVMNPVSIASNRVNVGCNTAYGRRMGLRLIEADGFGNLVNGSNHGDRRDPFPGFLGKTEFSDLTTPSTRATPPNCDVPIGAVTNIALRQIEQVGHNMRYQIQVRSPGWDPPVSVAPSGFQPVWPSGAANRALTTPDGAVVTVFAERRGGRTQILLRSRSRFGSWEDPIEVSESPVYAQDPCIAALPSGNDFVVIWSDYRHGAGELYFRSRIGGTWSPERRLTDLAGDSRYPSAGVDRYGRVHLAWLYTEGASSRIRFMTFTYYSPFGMSVLVTPSTELPDAPVVAVTPDGVANIFWVYRPIATSTLPPGLPTVWRATYSAQAGLSYPQVIAANAANQPAVDACADLGGSVHVVWQVSASGGVNQIRYQRYPPGGSPVSPRDSVIVQRVESVQNPTIRADHNLGLHLGFIAMTGGVPQVRYKRRHPTRGWDYAGAEVTLPSEGTAGRPAIVPGLQEEISIFYLMPTADQERLLERRRFRASELVGVGDPVTPAPRIALRLGPNPLRAGSPLVFRLPDDSAAPDRVVEVFDLSGRRIASATSGEGGVTAEIPGTITRGWQSGVYFARLRGDLAPAARLVVLH